MADKKPAGTQPTLENHAPTTAPAPAPADTIHLSPDLWRNICEASFDFVFVINRNGDIVFANKTLGESVGIAPTNLLHKNLHELFQELKKEHEMEEDLLHTSSMAGLIQKGLVKSQSLHLITADGSPFPVLLSASPVELDSSGTRGAVCIAKDMRTERQREKQMLDIQERLNHSVMASMADIAGGIAHEINNPLAVITGRLRQIGKLLSEPTPNLTAITTSIENMQAHAARIAFVVSSLKSLCHDASADVPDQCSATDLIMDVIGLFRDRAASNNIRIERNALVEAVILARQVQLKQALFQIISNAIAATADHPSPWIRIESSLSPDNAIEIAVTDCGTGIAENLREKIFQPFFSTKEIGQGQGIGLPTARAIVESHGGKLTLDSSCANTRFIIRLPVVVDAGITGNHTISKAS